MKAEDIRAQTLDQLGDQLASLKKEQFNLRFQTRDRPAGEDRARARGAPRHRAHQDHRGAEARRGKAKG